MNKKQNGFIGIILMICLIIIGFIIWKIGYDSEQAECKKRYGDAYTLWQADANSSIVACKSPDGTLKELDTKEK